MFRGECGWESATPWTVLSLAVVVYPESEAFTEGGSNPDGAPTGVPLPSGVRLRVAEVPFAHGVCEATDVVAAGVVPEAALLKGRGTGLTNPPVL